MNTKTAIYLVATILLTTFSFAEAQLPRKVPGIGFLAGNGETKNPGFTSRHSAKG